MCTCVCRCGERVCVLILERRGISFIKTDKTSNKQTKHANLLIIETPEDVRVKAVCHPVPFGMAIPTQL